MTFPFNVELYERTLLNVGCYGPCTTDRVLIFFCEGTRLIDKQLHEVIDA